MLIDGRGISPHAQARQASRKRQVLVDTLGLPITWFVPPADIHDTVGARKFFGGLAFFVPRLKLIWADAVYRGKELADWRQQQGRKVHVTHGATICPAEAERTRGAPSFACAAFPKIPIANAISHPMHTDRQALRASRQNLRQQIVTWPGRLRTDCEGRT